MLKAVRQTPILLGIVLVASWPVPTSAQTVTAKNALVASAHPLATQAGVEILQKGGNAIDAAIATTLAISVVEPFSAGIGGGGFALVRDAKTQQMTALDFRETAPAAATATMYLDAQGQPIPQASLVGFKAAATPGTIAGLAELHRRYGNLAWADLVQPAIRYAQDGFIVTPRLAQVSAWQANNLSQNYAAKALFTNDGQPLKVGERVIQTDLAKTLTAIAENPQTFYTGWIGEEIVREMITYGGLITAQDLANYKPVWRSPLCFPWQTYQVCSMPPPSSGGVALAQILNLLPLPNFTQSGRESPETLHQLAAAMQIAYADRAVYLGDPDFVDVPVEALISSDYAQARRLEILPSQARSANHVQAGDPQLIKQLQTKLESENTSHLTVVDQQRNVVSLTFTINGPFGAAVVAEGTGIVLNNEMDDFAIAPNTPNFFGLVGEQANQIAPLKRPLSSMSPTIVTKNGQFVLATGSPGGSRIITTVLQTLLNRLAWNRSPAEAINARRIHQQWQPDVLFLETGFPLATKSALENYGYKLQERQPWGNANLIEAGPGGKLAGAADQRGEGTVAGF